MPEVLKVPVSLGSSELDGPLVFPSTWQLHTFVSSRILLSGQPSFPLASASFPLRYESLWTWKGLSRVITVFPSCVSESSSHSFLLIVNHKLEAKESKRVHSIWGQQKRICRRRQWPRGSHKPPVQDVGTKWCSSEGGAIKENCIKMWRLLLAQVNWSRLT